MRLTSEQLALPRGGRHGEIYHRVAEFVRSTGCIHNGETVVLGVSGGADSTALTLLLAPLRHWYSQQLHIAYFDHRLRSREEVEEDIVYVGNLADRLAISFCSGAKDVRAYAKRLGLSIEDAARRLRYRFLADTAASLGASVIVLGHTASDQAETVLHRIIRGTGLDGLSGMLPRAPWPFPGSGLELARPLLCLAREETEFYCREFELTPRDDSSNLILDATRNRIRHRVMPILKEINPRVEQSLGQLARNAEGDVAYLDRQAEAIWQSLGRRSNGDIVFSINELYDLDRALMARVLQRAFRALALRGTQLDGIHIEKIDSLIHSSKKTWRISLPGRVRVVAGRRNVRVMLGDPQPALPIPETSLTVPGLTQVGGWSIRTDLEPPPPTPATQDRLEAYLDADKAGADLAVRSRRPGDRLRPLGLGGEKKLQDILVDAKVPARERDGVPLVCSGDQIVWVVGHCIDERYALRPTSRRAIHLLAAPTPNT